MKCQKCGNKVNLKDAKFCPFCGGTVEKEEELAGYTRGQFFSYTGDDEFREAWGLVRNMNADEALAWLREHPPVHYVYRFFGEYNSKDHKGREKRYSGVIFKEDIKNYCEDGDEVIAKECKLRISFLSQFAGNAFFRKEECEAAIKKELEKSEVDHA